MNYFFLMFAFIFIFTAACAFKAYSSGAAKTLKHLAAICISLLISGLAIRIGAAFAPKMQRITFLIAGIGALFFYSSLNYIFNSGLPGRYNYISKSSRRFACFFSIIEAWLILSFIYFFISSFLPYPAKYTELFKQTAAILSLPIKIFWFFPK